MNKSACHSEAAHLLPWFVTGRLDPDQRALVEAHLVSCPACRGDLEHERALHGLLRPDDRVDESGATAGFQKLITRIGETERALPAETPVPRETASVRRRAPRWVAGAVLAQALALTLVGVALWRYAGQASDAPYRTLSSDSASNASATAQLRVVFAPGTTTQELAGILDRIDARIVDGPSPAGAYALALSSGATDRAAVGATLGTLRADPRVILAEPIRAEPAP